jgi:uncharacterized protein
LRSLDRILSQAWQQGSSLVHVLAYSDPSAELRSVDGLLDDYAFTVNACLDAYVATADLSYFKFAHNLADAMITKFLDPVGGGFFDSLAPAGQSLGVLGTQRKPFQDSPTPAGNPIAAIALLRLHAFTNQSNYREKAEQTLEVFAGVAAQYGMFAGTYGIAAVHFSQPHTQVVVIGEDKKAEELERAAIRTFAFNKEVLKLTFNEAVAPNLPPALAETIPNLPALQARESIAVVCSGFSCLPPFSDTDELTRALTSPPVAA